MTALSLDVMQGRRRPTGQAPQEALAPAARGRGRGYGYGRGGAGREQRGRRRGAG